MKRNLHVLLMLLTLLSTAGVAEARKTRPKKAKAPQTIEMTLTSDKESEAKPAPQGDRSRKQSNSDHEPTVVPKPKPIPSGPPVELQLKRANSRHFDLRSLPHTAPPARDRVEYPDPVSNPVTIQGTVAPPTPETSAPRPAAAVQAPPPINVFDGLDRFNWGAGSPPDTNGDVGPTHFIQTVNSSIGVYRKSDGFQDAAFSFNTFMSQGNFGNLCDTNNFGDPVVLYDTFEDRWIITDFAFLVDGGGNPITPAYQCFAASMSGNPVSGGWNFYSIQVTDALNDYPKFGIWTDGLYMSGNMFNFGGGTFKNARVWAFNKAQMYAGSPTVKVVSFDVGGGDFTVVPGNARLQTGTPPAGRPNLFLSTQLFLNALTVYKFHVDWDHLTLSTFTGPDTPISATSWPTFAAAVPQPGTAQTLDSLSNRAMVQNQYTNFGGTESLWVSHTVRRQNTSGFAAPRWYQVDVTGGTVAGTILQAATWDPDAANVVHRWMPSVALDRAGNLAMGYSTSNATTEFPSIKYAGRLAGDAVNTFTKSEQTLFAGTASQTSSTRWGDYSAMTLDPDGCTFWYTTEYANPADQTFNHRWLTKFGSFRYPECTPVGAGGTISGAVTTNPGGSAIAGATVLLGSRSTTTSLSGNYSFAVPAGTYPLMTAAKPGFGSAASSSIAVTDGNTTTQNFSLAAAPASSCLTDTTQNDFQGGVPTNVDLNASPGDVTLLNAPVVDQSNTAGTSTGTGFGTPAWCGQTFIAGLTGQMVKADIQLFCNGCGGTPPNLTLSVRNTAAGLPTGADLATVTIPGSAFASGATTLFTATFASPFTVTSGTQYALILRPVSAPLGSGYFWIRSSPSTYASGSRVLSADSGGTWSADTTRDYNFKTYIQVGYAPSGTLVSSPKDANAAGGFTSIWSNFSWNAITPANTAVKFQLAGSNSVNGPFNFAGPDGTAGTFFTTSPVPLSPQFYNFRYLEYKAILTSTDNTMTPTLNDATACFNDVDCSTTQATITPGFASVCTSSAGNTASGPAGMTAYAWGITNGTITSATNIQTITYTAGASGTVTLTLSVTAPNGCIASGSTPVTINPLPATPTITGTLAFCTPGSTTLFSSAATGNQWYLGGNPIGGATSNNYVATAAGSYTVQVTDGNGCISAMSAAAVVTTNPTPATPTVTPGGPTTFCAGGSVTLTSSSATGNQWYDGATLLGGQTNQTYVATTSGSYKVVVTASGCPSAASAATSVTANPTPATPTINAGGPTTFCAGGSVTLTSSSASGNQWSLNGNPIGGATNSTYAATLTGDYTVVVTALGCPSLASAATSVTVNPLPATPTINAGGPTTFCNGGSVTLTSSSATGNQWSLNGNPIGGATANTYVATATGSYTVRVTDGNACSSASSAATSVTVNPIPPTPVIGTGGPTTFCAGGSVSLVSSSASGNQWYLNANPIGGATNQTYNATATGSYTVIVTTSGCVSAASAATSVTVNPIPATPTISGGPTTFCTGGNVTLTSSSASGNQWSLNGNPIGGATSQTYATSTAGDYRVIVTASGCSSAASAVKTVVVNPVPNATITAPSNVITGSTGNAASVANAGAGATYSWSITGGTITGGVGTNAITFTAGAVGPLTLQVTVTTPAGCSDTKSANVTVAVPPVTVTSVSPSSGTPAGNTAVTINGTGFQSGATVSFGASAATNVVVVSAIKITAKTPAHGVGSVAVKVTNPDTTNASLAAGYLYTPQFNVNGDGVVDPADIFYLINYLFLNGPAPMGPAGILSGDANGDGVVDPADIFYLVKYLFNGGPAPMIVAPRVTTSSVFAPMSGSVSLGQPVLRANRYVVPVILTWSGAAPQAMSLKVVFDRTGVASTATIRRAGEMAKAQPVFEIVRSTEGTLSYLVSYDRALGNGGSAVVAEIELGARAAAGSLHVGVDAAGTLLSDEGGVRKATVGTQTLTVNGIVIEGETREPRAPRSVE
jgi:hypothetical protein